LGYRRCNDAIIAKIVPCLPRGAAAAQPPNSTSPSRELGPLPAPVYIKCGLIETVSRATTAIGPEPIVPVPDGASADSASVLAARESEHQPLRPTRRKRLRCVGRGCNDVFI
jgi:hypothetical protein